MFKNWSIALKLGVGFGALALLLLVVGGAALIDVDALSRDILAIGDDADMADNAMEAKFAISQLMVMSEGARDTQSLEGLATIRSEFDRLNESVEGKVDRIIEISESDTSDSQHLDVIELANQADEQHDGTMVPALTELLDLLEQQLRSPDDATLAAKIEAADTVLMESGALIVEEMTALEDVTDSMVEEGNAAAAATVSLARTQAIILLVVGVVLAIGLAVTTTRSITKPLERVIAGMTAGAEQVTSAANQVAQASQQMAQGASEQASSLEETSSSLEEMSSMTRQNAENSKQADVMAREQRVSAGKGVEAMDKMSDAIGRIKESADSTAKIVKTIDEIAFQTNLLALNAAVEAARAGEAGKGFAVVAEEVRNLAQRSAEAAKTTSALIEGSQVNADGGVKVTGEVGNLLKQIAEQADKVTSLVSEVAAASDEQAQGIDQINTAVSEMDRVTQSSASNSEESASASEELSAQARELQDMVIQLRVVVGGAKAAKKVDEYGYAISSGQRTPAPIDHGLSQSVHSVLHKGSGASRRPASMVSGTSPRPEEVIPLDDDEMKDF